MKARLSALAGLLFTTFSVHAAPDPVAEAGALLERGNFRAAAERLRAAAPFAREQVQARFLFATALAGAGDSEGAARQFEQLIADFPQQPEPYNNLAALYASQGQLDKAKEVLERGMRTDPSYAAVYDNLSSIYVEMARASYAKALRVNEAAHSPSLQLLYAMNGPQPAAEVATTVLAAAEPAPVVEAKPPAPVPVPPKAEPVTRPTPPPAAAAAPVPAAPVATAAAPNAAANAQAAVTNALQEWARAWSARDVEAYLGFYAADFNPVGSQTRAQWVAERRERLATAQSISVTLENFQVQMVSSQRAIATMIQDYRSSSYGDRTRKQFTLVKVGERWLIRNEKSLGIAP